jgi:thioredoxin reductase (NADPH)
MTASTQSGSLDLLVVGAGPTGIAIGAEATRAGLEVLLVDRGPLVANLLDFPTYMTFFTTRDLLEVAGIPFAIPQDKPDRRQAIAYYQSIARQFDLDIAPHEEVESAHRDGDFFEVVSTRGGQEVHRRAKAIAIATGYFHLPKHLGVPGEKQTWVKDRYIEPYGHFGETVVVVGGGNSALEAALDLWRNGARVTVVHRGTSVKETVKYWVRPDFENRVEEGSIAIRYESRVERFGDGYVEIESPSGMERIAVDAAYPLIGYLPDVDLLARFGIEIDPVTLVPEFDSMTCETNVPGVYVAGTLQAGRDTGRIFIENSREHGLMIVKNLSERLGKALESE